MTDPSKPRLENFYKRLQIWIEKRNEATLRSQELANLDEKTGNPLFIPTTRPKDIDNVEERDVFESLYEDKKRRDVKQNDTETANYDEIQKQANAKLSTSRTDELNNKLKDECFAHLFDILDIDSDNVISYSEDLLTLLQTQVSTEVLELLSPLLEELKEHNESLTFEEFGLAINQLFAGYNVNEKRKVLSWYTEVKRQNSPKKLRFAGNSDFAFKPTLTNNTAKIYQASNRYSKDFIERNKELEATRETFHKNMVEIKLAEETKGKISPF